MVITGLRKCRGRLYLLEIDGAAAQTVDIATFEESPYKVGSSLTMRQLKELTALSNARRAKEKALYLLSLRDHSCGELERKLCAVADEETAALTVGRMRELGLVDDARFARTRAQYLINRKLYPKRRAFAELCALGVDRETARDAVESIETDDADRALALLNKKHYNKKDCRKAAAALGRYGFDGDTIRRAMSQWLSEEWEIDNNEL